MNSNHDDNPYYEDARCTSPCGAEPMGCSTCDISYATAWTPDDWDEEFDETFTD